MSVIEDTRKLVQDFLAPELRTISARLDALDAKVDASQRTLNEKIDITHRSLDTKIDTIHGSLDAKIETIHRSLDAKIDSNHREVMLGIANLANYQAVLDRLAKVEARTEKSNQQ